MKGSRPNLLMPHKHFRPFASVSKMNLTSVELRACLVVGLWEFQRTQCFFAYAMQIASIITLGMGAQATTIGQAGANLSLIVTVAQNNAFCISFLYWYLRRNLENSLYMIILPCVAFILNITATSLAMGQYQRLKLDDIQGGHGYALCEGIDPARACALNPIMDSFALDLGNLKISDGQFLSLALILVCLLEDYVPNLVHRLENLHIMKCSFGFEDLGMLRAVYARRKAFRFVMEALWLWGTFMLLAVLLGSHAASFGFFMQFDPDEQVGWSFGQIVAVTVWAQPLAEFVRLYLRECPVSIELQSCPLTHLTDKVSSNGHKNVTNHHAPLISDAREPERKARKRDKICDIESSRPERWLRRLGVLKDLLFCRPGPWELSQGDQRGQVRCGESFDESESSVDANNSEGIESRLLRHRRTLTV